MEENKNVTDFFIEVMRLVNQIKTRGEILTSRSIISNILRSLLPKLDRVVVAIEESKDLSSMKKEDLQGTLESHG